MDGWLVIPKWDKFQSRKDRHDPWIKHHVDQLDRVDYLMLTLAERGLLADLRAAYSRHNGQLALNIVPGYIHARVFQKQLERLKEAGYIDISAAKPPPLGSALAARAREEEERELDTPLPPQSGGWGKLRDNGENPRALGTNPRAVGKAEKRARTWIANGLAETVPPERLGDVLADEFGITDTDLIAGLVRLARGER